MTGRPRIAHASFRVSTLAAAFLAVWQWPSTTSASVNAKGAYQKAVTIQVPAFHGIQPRVVLTYDSTSGNGPVGFGWRLEADSRITRSSPGGGAPRYDSTDVFWIDGVELGTCAGTAGSRSLSCRTGGTHFPRAEDFRRYRLDATATTNRWTIWNRNGVRMEYLAQLGDTSVANRTLRWVLDSVVDTHGNRVAYIYNCGPRECWLTSISYGTGATCKPSQDRPVGTVLPGALIEFRWEGRPDILTMAQGGFLEEMTRRLKRIDVTEQGERARTYELTYQPELSGLLGWRLNRSWLASIRMFGRDLKFDANGNIVGGTSLPEQTFEAPAQRTAPAAPFGNVLAGDRFVPVGPTPSSLPVLYDSRRPQTLSPTLVIHHTLDGGVAEVTSQTGVTVGDFDGDSLLDFMQWTLDGTCANLQIGAMLARSAAPDLLTTQNPWAGAKECQTRATRAYAADLNGDRRTDLAFLQYRKTEPFEPTDLRYQADLVSGMSNGDGTLTASVVTNLWISADRDQLFASRCGVGDPNGDGRADIVCLTMQNRRWTIVQGLSDGDSTVRIQRAFPTPQLTSEHILSLADANGDGLTDIVFLDVEGTGSSRTMALRIGLSLGDGSYSWRTQPVALPPVAANEKAQLLTGDFNADRRADLLLAIEHSGTSGSFTTFMTSGGASAIYRVARQSFSGEMPASSTGDMNGDGLADVLLSFRHPPHSSATCNFNATEDHASLFWVVSREGTMSFPPAASPCYTETNFWAGPWTSDSNPFAAQVNGDHRADVFQYAAQYVNGTLRHVLRDRPGEFSGDELYARWRQSDVDGDGRTDWIFTTFGNPGLIVSEARAQADGTFSFASQTVLSSAGDLASPNAVAHWLLADVGSPGGGPDGRADIVVIDDARQRIVTLLAQGRGAWVPVPTGYQAASTVLRGHVITHRGDKFNWRPMDVNGDGLTDLVHTSFEQPATGRGTLQVETLLAQGDGTWQGPIHARHLVAAFDEANVQDFMASDVNGDGRADLVLVSTYAGQTFGGTANTAIRTLIATGSGTWRETGAQIVAQPFQSARRWLPMEVNGDGRADLVHFSSLPGGQPTITYLLALGNGGWADVQSVPLAPNPTAIDTQAALDVQLADLDRDGQQEILLVANVPAPTGPALRTGLLILWNRYPAFIPRWTTDLDFASARTSGWSLTDFRADDQPELVRLRAVAPPMIESVSLPAPGIRVTRTTNGMGGSEEVVYGTSAGSHRMLPVGALARVVQSVSVRTSDNAAPVSVETYTYSGALYLHGRRRQFAGFERVVVADTLQITATDYDLDDRCGVVARQTDLLSPDQRLIRRMVRTFEPLPSSSLAPAYCRELSIRIEEWEQAAAARTAVATTTYDGWGNVESVREEGDPAKREDDRLFETAVNPLVDANHYIIDRPTFRRIVAFDAAGMPRTLAETRYEYDNSGSYLNPPGAVGDMTREDRFDEPLTRWATSRFEYDSRGNTIRFTGPGIPSNPKGVSLTIDHDCEFVRFPSRVCDGSSCSSLEWDRPMGAVREIRDPNGAATTVQLDALGRPERVLYPDKSFERWRWPAPTDWNTPRQALTHEMSDGSAGGGVTWITSRLDGLGRTIAVTREGDAQQEVSGYEGASTRVTARSAPHRAAEPPQITRYAYDPAGRLRLVQHPDGSARRVAFAVGLKTVTDEIGATTTYEFDRFGRIEAIRENRRDCVAETCPVVESATTRYGYDALDRLVRVLDHAKSETTLAWSAFGPIRVCDPDRGCVTSSWNLDGSLESERDAGGVRLLRYDPLGRVVERETRDPSRNLTRLVKWTWDVDPLTKKVSGASLGRVTHLEDAARATLVTTYRYDSMGRPERERSCVDGACADLARKFDEGGRVRVLDMVATLGGSVAAKQQVEYRYDEAGYLTAIPGVLPRVGHDAAGRLASVDFANGLREIHRYDPQRGWLESVTIQPRPLAKPLPPLFSQVRDLDVAGHVRSETILGLLGTRKESYTHDDLGRLRTVTSTDPARNQTFDFDLVGNLTFHSRLGRIFRNDPAHVHAATDTVSGERYLYDSLGRMFRSNAMEIDWNPDGRPDRVLDRLTKEQTEFDFDWSGRLIRRTSAAGRFRSPDPLVEIDPSGSVAFSIPADGRRVARVDAGRLTFLHGDVFGSTRLVSDALRGVVAQQDYGIWGDHTPAPGGSAYGFLGGLSIGSSGLVQLGARFYLPVLGQFVSPDPTIPRLYAPQALNRYRYALNDPVTLSDPTGYAPEGFKLWGDEPEQGHNLPGVGPPSDPSEWAPYPKGLSDPPLVRFWETSWYPWMPRPRTIQELMGPLPARDETRDGPQLRAPIQRNPAPIFGDARDDMLQNSIRAPLAASLGAAAGGAAVGQAILAAADGLGVGEAIKNDDTTMIVIGTIGTALNAAAVSKVPEVGASRPPVSERTNAGTPFNPEPWVDPHNCVKCVASLLDAIFNEDFVQQANQYRSTVANKGLIGRALAYLREMVKVDFGRDLNHIPGGWVEPGDYVVFSDFVGNRAQHISFARSVQGELHFYDPQNGSTAPPTGPYTLNRVRYPE